MILSTHPGDYGMILSTHPKYSHMILPTELGDSDMIMQTYPGDSNMILTTFPGDSGMILSTHLGDCDMTDKPSRGSDMAQITYSQLLIDRIDNPPRGLLTSGFHRYFIVHFWHYKKHKHAPYY